MYPQVDISLQEESSTDFQPNFPSCKGTFPGAKNEKPSTLSRATSLALFKSIVTNKLSSASIRPHAWFPLPADHLLTLIQFNVYRAIMTNMEFLIQARLQNLPSVPTAAPSQLTRASLPPIPPALPPSLAPTLQQQQIAHPSWIDAIPHATLRDNLTSGIGTYDEVALCLDTLGCLFHDYSDDSYEDRKGLIVWSDPWNVSSWELAEGFVREWGALLTGMWRIYRSQNHWRLLRGESSLAVGV